MHLIVLLPLYILPYVVPSGNAEKYRELEKAKWELSARNAHESS